MKATVIFSHSQELDWLCILGYGVGFMEFGERGSGTAQDFWHWVWQLQSPLWNCSPGFNIRMINMLHPLDSFSQESCLVCLAGSQLPLLENSSAEEGCLGSQPSSG